MNTYRIKCAVLHIVDIYMSYKYLVMIEVREQHS